MPDPHPDLEREAREEAAIRARRCYEEWRKGGDAEPAIDALHDHLRSVYTLLAAAEQRIEELREALIPDVLILIQDHFSGLPEHRAPVMDAIGRLAALLEDEDGNPLPEPNFAARREMIEHLAALDKSAERERG